MESSNLVFEKKEYLLLKRLINLSFYVNDETSLNTLEKLSSSLEKAQINHDLDMPKNVVRINSMVTLSFMDLHVSTLQLVMPSENQSGQNKVSIVTLLGAALIGQREGTTITLKDSTRIMKFKIIKVNQVNKNISLDMIL